MKPNDIIATITGCCLMAASLMLAFYAGMQKGIGQDQNYLIMGAILMPLGAVCVWSGVNAILAAVRGVK